MSSPQVLVADDAQTTDLFEARAGIYWFFASLYAAELEQSGLDSLVRGEGWQLLQGLAQEPELTKVCSALQQALQDLAEQSDALLLLRAQFTQLFLLDYKSAAPPYASVYSSSEHLLFQEPHRLMSDLLANQGLEVSSGFNEPADHLAIELDYLGNLILRGLEQPFSQALQEQLDFIDHQLLSWYPDFAARVLQLEAKGVYPALTKLLGGFLRQDRDWLLTLSGELAALN